MQSQPSFPSRDQTKFGAVYVLGRRRQRLESGTSIQIVRRWNVQSPLHVLTPSDNMQYNLHMSTFTPGELNVMRLLWEHGELKPSQIQERFPEPIKNPAVRSYLTILV